MSIDGRAAPGPAEVNEGDTDTICLKPDDLAGLKAPSFAAGTVDAGDSSCDFPEFLRPARASAAGAAARVAMERSPGLAHRASSSTPRLLQMEITTEGHASAAIAPMLGLKAGQSFTARYQGTLRWVSAGCTAED